MKTFIEPDRSTWKALCERPADCNPTVRERVSAILSRVRKDGDKALSELSSEIDGIALDTPQVSRQELEDSAKNISPALIKAIEQAVSNITAFHKAQLPHTIEVETCPGVKCIQKPVPIRKVGLYIPGGTAPLFSTVLMLAIPARLAGCGEVILCTPCGKDGKVAPAVLYAAHRCGIEKVFRVGGAQAIAAMAYGTQSISAVDKIFGPGNQYVTTAKQMVSGSTVAIDMPAGPSEVMVIADRSSSPAAAAADLLSQAEHGRDSQVVLVSDSSDVAAAVEAEVKRQIVNLGRCELAECALEKSRSVVFGDIADTVDFANAYAPEHLIISTENPHLIADRIMCAGSVFIGAYTPESAGDYASGTNHTLPTSAWARSYSGVNIDSFIRKMTIQEISRSGLESLSSTIVEMAGAEGLDAHANAVKIRLNGTKL